MKTIQAALEQGTHVLAASGIGHARLDAQVLLGHVLGVERAILYAYPEREMSQSQEQQYVALLARRQQHEPVAYLLGHKGFYGLDLLVDQRVLIPRPETELLVEAALAVIRSRLADGYIPLVADIGTGSGAIPIAIAVEEPRLPSIYACDISMDALAVARLNCQRYHVEERIHLLQGDLVAPLPEPVDVLLANLPYVGTTEIVSMEADVYAYEPHQAVFSGPDGLGLLLRLCKEIQQSGTLRRGGTMILEIGYQQRAMLTEHLHDLWPVAVISYKQDYAGWDRLVQVMI